MTGVCGTHIARTDAPARPVVADPCEHRVIRQLVEALLFERLIPYALRPLARAERRFEPVYDAEITFTLGVRSYRCVGAIKSWSRVRVADGSVECTSHRDARGDVLGALVTALDIPEEAKRRLLDELMQTLALSRWNRAHLPHQSRPRRGLSFPALEGAIVEGHTYHPCFKTRTGFTQRDHETYGPEAGAAFQLMWLAVDRGTVRIAVPGDDATFFARELGEDAYGSLTERLGVAGGDLDAYVLVPVHPWQMRALGPIGLDRAIADRTVIPLGAAGDFYTATQSVRTLVNATRPEKPNIKLPLDIVCTSTRRILKDHFACTAPALSAWLVSLVSSDPFLEHGARLGMLSEYAALLLEVDEGTAALEGRLGVIFRESICAKLAPGEEAVPFTALALVESDGRPFIADWVEAQGAVRFTERLLEVMLVPLWHMLVHHGIAFEAHAQNLILVHRGGVPERIVLRDFHEDTEYVPDFLRDPASVPDFTAVDPFFETIPDDDGYRMAEVESLRELFMDTVYVYNLAEISFLFERFFGLTETRFWEMARACLDAYARAGVTDAARIRRVSCDREEILVESLLKKKILDGRLLDFFGHTIRNTLNG